MSINVTVEAAVMLAEWVPLFSGMTVILSLSEW
jgi:hypothetical protein